MKNLRIFSASLLAFALFGFAVMPVYAAEFMAPGQEDNGAITVTNATPHKNLYVAGGAVVVDSPVSGDLITAGGTVTVNGDVEQDLWSAGGNVTINGKVGGDLRVAGGTLTIKNPIGGDLLVGGGTVTIDATSSIAGDLTIGSGTLVLNAPVTGDVKIGGGSITINSKINGSLWVGSDTNLVFGEKADVAGKITHRGPKTAVIKEGAKVSEIAFTQLEKQSQKNPMTGLFTGLFVIKLLALFVAGLVLLKLMRQPLEHFAQDFKSHPWEALGIGLVALFAIPIIGVFLAVTVVGFYLAMIVFLMFALAFIFAGVSAIISIGAVIIKALMKKPSLVLDWQAVAIGAVVFLIIGFIPVIGWLACMITFLISFGTIVRYFWHKVKGQQSLPIL